MSESHLIVSAMKLIWPEVFCCALPFAPGLSIISYDIRTWYSPTLTYDCVCNSFIEKMRMLP
jgi:hypothetical protein